MSGGTITPEARVGNVPIQQSAQGVVVPLVYGKNRVGVNLIWYGDFESVEKQESQGGKGGIDTVSFDYYAAIIGAVGQGSLGINRVWRAQQKYLAAEMGDKLGLEWYNGSAGQGVWTWLQSTHSGQHVHEGGGGGFAITNMFVNEGVITVWFASQPSPPFAVGSQITVGGMDPAEHNGTFTVQACTTESVSYASQVTALAESYGSVTSTSKTLQHEDIGYSGTAYLACVRYALDQGAQIPNHTAEVTNMATGPTPLPMVIVRDLLTRCGIDNSIVQADGVDAYATAMGITCSPAITSATPTADLIDQLAVINNVGIVPSEGKLKFVPYAAQAVGDFTPNLTPAYDLTDDDFIAPGGDPITITRKSEADTFNHVQCEFADALLDYNTSITEAKDDESISRSGLRTKDKITLLGVTNANVARLVAQQVLQREIAVRNAYEFTLSPRHVLLEPMDFVTLTDSLLGLDKLVVRITSVNEQDDGTIKISAEDAPLSAFNPALYAYQSNAGFIANYNIDPGNVTAPAFFEPPSAKTTTGLEVWCAVSGQSPNWGGCDVWVSMDGTNYKFDQTIERGSRYGTLSAALPSGATTGLSVNLAGLGGQLLSGSLADAAALNTLCWVGDATGGEFLSYQVASMTAANAYTLDGLLRGAYGTLTSAKAAGSQFVRVDGGIGKSEPLDPQMVGKTIYFKFCSHNIYGAQKQSLVGVQAYSYTITGNMLKLSNTGEALNPSWSPQTITVPSNADGTGSVTGQTTALTLYAGEIKVPFSAETTDAAMPAGSVRIVSATPTAGLTVSGPVLSETSASWTVDALTAQQTTLTVLLRYKNSLGNVYDVGTTVQVTQLRAGVSGSTPPSVDVSGYTGFSVNAGGLFSPATATLSAVIEGITGATYSWSITGATPATANTSSVVITPQTGVSTISAVLTVSAPGLANPITKTVAMPVVYSGQPGQAGANGVQSAYPSIYIWTSSSTPPARPTTNSTYTWATAGYTAPAGWATIAPNNTAPNQYLWEITVPLAVSATTASSALTWTNTSYPIRNTAYNGSNGIDGTDGLNGTRTAVLDLYRWSTGAPTTFPSGSSTYTWATSQFTSPGTLNGWTQTPGTPSAGQSLYLLSQLYADSAVTATSTVAWSATTPRVISLAGTNGAAGSAGTNGANGANGTRTAVLEVYRWAASAPTSFPSGTSTYTWATGAFTTPGTPNGWSLTPAAAVSGQTLWACSVVYADQGTTATNAVTWNTSTAYAVGAAGTSGTNGSNGSNGTNGSATYLVTRTLNSSSAPTAAETQTAIGRAAIVGDIAVVNYNSGNASIQYRYTATGYVQQSAYMTGSLIVQGTITSNLIAASGISCDKLSSGNMTSGTASKAIIQLGQSGAVIGTLQSSLNVRKITSDTSLVNIAAQNNLDGNVAIWGHSAAQVNGGNGTTGSHTAENTFSTWQRLGALGSGLANAGVWGFTYADNVNSKGGVFERYTGTNSGNTGILNKAIHLATASYCAHSPSGRGKIYIVDGSGPFTGFHEGMIDLNESIEIGDIVTDIDVFYRHSISNVLFSVARSNDANNSRVLGIVSNILPIGFGIPGILWVDEQTFNDEDLGPSTKMVIHPDFEIEALQSQYKVVQINALGEGQLNVCGQNGNINAGDLLVSSAIPGKCMKQDDNIVRSNSVAKARESVVFDDPAQIKMIACIYLCG